MIEVRSQQEIFSLDEELNLFNEDTWDFLNVSETADNYEFYNDIRDTDFTNVGRFKIFLDEYGLIIALILICLILILFSLSYVGVFKDNGSYEGIQNIGNSDGNMSNVTDYVDGEECSNSDLVVISKMLSNYTGVLKSKSSYDLLNSYCGNSSFYNTYLEYTNNIKESYDLNDCYARAFSQFGSFSSVNKIDKVVKKDDIYYCYVYLNMPTNDDIFQYIYMHQYDIAKYFTNHDIDEENIIKFMLDLTEQSAMTCSSVLYCVEFEKTEDGFLIHDDEVFTNTIINSYKEAVTDVTNIIKGNM